MTRADSESNPILDYLHSCFGVFHRRTAPDTLFAVGRNLAALAQKLHYSLIPLGHKSPVAPYFPLARDVLSAS
jgi:hypothetical protein